MPPKPEQIVARLHREFLRKVIAETKTPPTRIAREIDVSPSTLTRLLKETDDSVSALRASTIAKLEAFSGLELPSSNPDGAAPTSPALRGDATPFEMRDGDPTVAAAIKAIIGSHKNIDAWTIRSRALECAGYMPGDTVLVDLSTQPRAGEPACAQVYNWRGGAAETIMRLLEPPYLVAATYDPSLRKPLLVDDDRVIVKGLILPHRLRPRAN